MPTFRRLWRFLNWLFWVDRFDALPRDFSPLQAAYYRLASRFALYSYLTVVPLLVIFNLADLQWTTVIVLAAMVVLFPLQYRMVMGLAAWMNRVP